MTKKQAKYGLFVILFCFMLLSDKLFNLWKGWYGIDSVLLAYYLYLFIEESNANSNDNN